MSAYTIVFLNKKRPDQFKMDSTHESFKGVWETWE